MRPYLVLILFAIGSSLFAQSITISGKVIDSKDLQPVPLVAVFLSNTTIGNTTELNGEFSFKVQQPGTYELFFSLVGYNSHKMNITVKDININVGEIKLSINEVSVGQVEVKGERDKNWERDLKKFRKVFLGETKFATSAKINNPWVLEFKDDPEKGMVATASAPLEVENTALGYKVNYFLTDFWMQGAKYRINGSAQFVELDAPSKEQYAKWQSNRLNTYAPSLQHLFRAIINKRVYAEGFNLYTEREGYTNRDFRYNVFSSELGKSVKPFDTLNIVRSYSRGVYRIEIPNRLEIHYRFGEAVSPVYKDLTYPISWIELEKGYAVVNENGFPLNSVDIDIFGAMGQSRLANMLPLDYTPSGQLSTPKNQQSQFAYVERTFIHTDKEYYYPGETVWFKGYMRYGLPQFQDSLSKTVYVEFLNPTLTKVMQSKTFEIRNGAFQGEFQLSDSLLNKIYYLRAYTNLQRNYGDQQLFGLPIPIIEPTERAQRGSSPGIVNDSLFTIESDKPTHKLKEKITLTLKLKNTDGVGIGSNLSLSVVDIAQVASINISNIFLDRFASDFNEMPLSKRELRFLPEQGITFSGKLINKTENKPTELNILQLNSSFFTTTTTNAQGIFKIKDLPFYDTAAFTIQSIGKKSTKTEWSDLLKRERPALADFYRTEFQFRTIKSEIPQRIVRSGAIWAESATALNDVQVTSTPLQESYVNRSYGKPDFVLKGKDLATGNSTGNLLFALQGKVPGLIVRQMNSSTEGTKWVVYTQRGASSSLLNVKEVTVLVNDAFMSGSAGDILGTINPNNVESVEVKNGVNALYGSAGGFGTVSVYLKKDIPSNSKSGDRNFSTLLVPGYARSIRFISPDYSKPNNQPDYRSVIYWEPNIFTDPETGTATVSFYAADKPTVYRVVAIGMADDGRVLRCEYTFPIEP